MKIKVANNVFMIGVAGMVLKMLESVGSMIIMLSAGTFIEKMMDMFNNMNINTYGYGDLPQSIFDGMEGILRGIMYVSMTFGLLIAIAYALIFILYCAKGRKQPVGAPLFVVYLVFSALGILGSGGNFIGMIIQLAGNSVLPFGSGVAMSGAYLFEFVGTALVGASCILFLSEYSKEKERQKAERLKEFYSASSYGRSGNPPAPAPEVPVTPAETPASTDPASLPAEEGRACPVCGKKQRAGTIYCTYCGKPLTEGGNKKEKEYI